MTDYRDVARALSAMGDCETASRMMTEIQEEMDQTDELHRGKLRAAMLYWNRRGEQAQVDLDAALQDLDRLGYVMALLGRPVDLPGLLRHLATILEERRKASMVAD